MSGENVGWTRFGEDKRGNLKKKKKGFRLRTGVTVCAAFVVPFIILVHRSTHLYHSADVRNRNNRTRGKYHAVNKFATYSRCQVEKKKKKTCNFFVCRSTSHYARKKDARPLVLVATLKTARQHDSSAARLELVTYQHGGEGRRAVAVVVLVVVIVRVLMEPTIDTSVQMSDQSNAFPTNKLFAHEKKRRGPVGCNPPQPTRKPGGKSRNPTHKAAYFFFSSFIIWLWHWDSLLYFFRVNRVGYNSPFLKASEKATITKKRLLEHNHTALFIVGRARIPALSYKRNSSVAVHNTRKGWGATLEHVSRPETPIHYVGIPSVTNRHTVPSFADAPYDKIFVKSYKKS